MIYFHPGSFVLGDANYEAVNPKAMLDKEVLLVVPSYRLGNVLKYTQQHN